MANREGREALRGAEEKTFDLLSEVLTSEEWAQLLKAPLERAARKGNRGIAQKLVGAGAGMGKALHEAVLGGHKEVVNDLLEAGASIAGKDAKGNAPLHLAAEGGKSDIVSLLMVKGADKDAMNRLGCTPLYLAVVGGHEAAALALVDAGADVSPRCTFLRECVIHQAVQTDEVEISRAVLEHGADVDAASGRNYSALHMAAMHDAVEAIDVLIDAGANINARSMHGETPLHFAAYGGRPQAVLALLKHGADVNAQDRHRETPLHWAAKKYWAAKEAGTQGAQQVVDSLLRAGADETLLNDEGEAAADVACATAQYGGDTNRVQELLVNAPADRVWRRRGYLVLCRAHPDRVQLIQESSRAPAGVAPKTRSGTEPTRAERTSGGWADVVAMMLGLQEEGIFRAVVGYL